VNPNEYTAAQREAIRGFALTMMGNDLAIIAYLHQYGPTEVNEDPLAPPAAMKTQAEMLTRAAQYLDEAVPHLKAGGTAAFTFPMPTGFTQFAAGNFNRPSTGFLQFNRALRVRLDLFRRDYASAAAHIDSTFISLTGTRTGLNTGVYYTYSTASGDAQNGLNAGTPEVADARFRTDAQLKADGTRDDRYALKLDSGAVRTQLGISSNLRFALYRTRPFYGAGAGNSPIPIIRNEELILDRAEIRWFRGDHAGAMADLNFVRVNSGGLAPLADPGTDAGFIAALLYERRYSLMYEGGTRWMDLVRFNLRSTLANYPRTGDQIPQYYPVPFTECLARGGAGSAPGC
jgi:hypothetical protein